MRNLSIIVAGVVVAGAILFGLRGDVFAAFSDPFLSIQLAASPSNGLVLSTDGTNNTWSAAGAGDITGGASLGTGINIFDSESAGILRFNTISAGSNITISTSSNNNTLVIASTGGGGGTFAWTPGTFEGQDVNATSTGIRLLGSPLSLIASSSRITYASTTQLSVGSDYVTDLDGTGLTLTSGALNVDTSQNIATLSNLTGNGAILTSGGVGTLGTYAGTSCTNQFVRSLSGSIVATCATVGAADVSLANLTATDTTLTFSGTYTGATARTIGLNLANANTWTALQQLNANASTTQLSVYSNAYFGATATTTINSTGQVGVASSTPTGALSVEQGTEGYSVYVGNNGSSTPSFIIEGVNGNGDVGVGTTSPTKTFSVTGESWVSATSTAAGLNVLAPTTGTSTLHVYSKTAGFGGRVILEDSDAAGCTELYTLNGVLTAATITCPTEI